MPPSLNPGDWGRALIDVIYPESCAGCGARHRARDGHGFCPSCSDAIAWLKPPYCQACCEPFPGAISSEFQCVNCSGRKLHFDFAVSACESRGVVRDVIHRFKYEGGIHLREALGELLLRSLEEPRIASIPDWLIVPVALHAVRFREREYNQSLELAMVLARLSGHPMVDGLRRIRYTTAQANLDRRDRLENLRGAFRIKHRLLKSQAFQGKNILLVDDVFTTGSTGDECAQLLKKEGRAARVVVITVARG